MKLSIGDKVRFLNERGEGVVTKLISKTTVGVTIEDGFELPFLISGLVVIVDGSVVSVHSESRAKEDKKNPEKKKVRSTQPHISKPHVKNSAEYQMEIDLHIEELIDNYSGMSNAEIIQIQLRHLQKAIEKAISKHYRSLTIIHGVGNGRLKQEVRAVLTSYNLRFHDGSYSKYGYGATEVLIS